MSEEKGIRLSKIAKELSVGTNTIIEFLAAKGHKIDHNPNTKLSEELQRILSKEFQADKSAKEESLVISKLKEKETIVEPEAEDTYKPASKAESEPKEILIKNVSSVPFEEKKEAKKAEKPKEVKKEEEPEEKSPKAETQKQKPEEEEVIKAKAEQIEGPTVLGKIDLSSINSKTKPDKKKKLTKKEKEKALKEEKEKEEAIAAAAAAPEETTPLAEAPPAQETPIEEPPAVEAAPEPEPPKEKEKEEPFNSSKRIL